jgi:membrane carboxypeptidase/penicillin-binding protein
MKQLKIDKKRLVEIIQQELQEEADSFEDTPRNRMAEEVYTMLYEHFTSKGFPIDSTLNFTLQQSAYKSVDIALDKKE